MGRVLIVSKLDAIAQYKAIAEEYPVGFEPNDFFIPSVLDDADKTRFIEYLFLLQKNNLLYP